MRYVFFSAHCVQGISHPSGSADLVLLTDAQRGIRAVLTADAIQHLHLLNRHLALLSMMMRAMIKDPLPDEFPGLLAREIERVERQRRDLIGGDAVVIVELTGQIEAQIPLNARQIQDFILCFDAFDKRALKAKLRSQVSAVLTGLRIGAGDPLRFREIMDGSCLLADDGRVIHSVSVEGGNPSGYVSRPLNTERQAQVGSDMSLALRAGALERVMRLHAQSLSNETDNYRAFIAAWSALEILVAKLFPTYQQVLAAELRAVNQSPGLQAYLDRVATVMNSKHSLADKFAVLSVYLDSVATEDEIRTFKELKGVRDRLSHGEELDEAALPTKEVQRLFDKYLRTHLRRAD